MAKRWVQLFVPLIYCICCVRQLSSSTTYPTGVTKWSELNQKHLVVLISEVGNSISIFLFNISKFKLFIFFKKYPVSLRIQRNTTGHVVTMNGASPLILDWLSRQYKFTYVIILKNNKVFY